VPGITGNVMSERRDAFIAREGRMPLSTDAKTEVLRKLQGQIYFKKTLSATNASLPGRSTPTLVCAAG
jgi:hypothetical protein